MKAMGVSADKLQTVENTTCAFLHTLAWEMDANCVVGGSTGCCLAFCGTREGKILAGVFSKWNPEKPLDSLTQSRKGYHQQNDTPNVVGTARWCSTVAFVRLCFSAFGAHVCVCVCAVRGWNAHEWPLGLVEVLLALCVCAVQFVACCLL